MIAINEDYAIDVGERNGDYTYELYDRSDTEEPIYVVKAGSAHTSSEETMKAFGERMIIRYREVVDA